MAGQVVSQLLMPAMALPARLEPYKKLLGVLVRQNCISIAVSNPYLNLAEPLGAVMLREGRLPGRSFQRLLSGEQQQLAGFVMAFEVPDKVLQQDVQAAATHQQLNQLHDQQQLPLLQAVINPQQEAAAAQVHAALQSLRPGLLGGWYGGWSAQLVGASCRVQPPAGPAAAAATAAAPYAAAASTSSATPSSTQEQQQQEGQLASSIAGSQTVVGAAAGLGVSAAGPAAQQPLCSLGQQFLQSYLDSLGSLNTFG